MSCVRDAVSHFRAILPQVLNMTSLVDLSDSSQFHFLKDANLFILRPMG